MLLWLDGLRDLPNSRPSFKGHVINEPKYTIKNDSLTTVLLDRFIIKIGLYKSIYVYYIIYITYYIRIYIYYIIYFTYYIDILYNIYMYDICIYMHIYYTSSIM